MELDVDECGLLFGSPSPSSELPCGSPALSASSAHTPSAVLVFSELDFLQKPKTQTFRSFFYVRALLSTELSLSDHDSICSDAQIIDFSFQVRTDRAEVCNMISSTKMNLLDNLFNDATMIGTRSYSSFSMIT